jgi:hypothetical protein
VLLKPLNIRRRPALALLITTIVLSDIPDASNSLAVYGYDFPADFLANSFHPLGKTVFDSLRVQCGENVAKSNDNIPFIKNSVESVSSFSGN